MNEKHIEVERMLFQDYRVQVWDENLSSMLDREYFCRGFLSATHTAFEIQSNLFPGLPIFSRDDEKVKLLSRGDVSEERMFDIIKALQENHEMDEPKTE